MKQPSSFLSRFLAVPPYLWFLVSAIFRYLGPAFAVLLFERIDALGVAWFRITSAAIVFALWAQPWRTLRTANRQTMMLFLSLGACLALMNSAFYLAIERLPLSLVATMEFISTIVLALLGLKTMRNYMALGIAVAGVTMLIEVQWSNNLLGLSFAAVNALLFLAYIVLSHRVAQQGVDEGVAELGAAMTAAFVFIMPIGVQDAIPALTSPVLILAGVGVGICSSVVPYLCDQLAMAQLTRSTYALSLALLPAIATLIAIVVLRQIPTLMDICGVVLVMLGVTLQQPTERL